MHWLVWFSAILIGLICFRFLVSACRSGGTERYSAPELDEIRKRHLLERKRDDLARMKTLAKVRARKSHYEENYALLHQAKSNLWSLMFAKADREPTREPTPRDHLGISIYGDAWHQSAVPLRLVMDSDPDSNPALQEAPRPPQPPPPPPPPPVRR